MGYRVRSSQQGGDRRHGRSLAQTLAAGRKPDPKSPMMSKPEYKDPEVNFAIEGHQPEAFEYWHESVPAEESSYDESVGPKRTTRRPVEGEWDPYTTMDRYNEFRGYNK